MSALFLMAALMLQVMDDTSLSLICGQTNPFSCSLLNGFFLFVLPSSLNSPGFLLDPFRGRTWPDPSFHIFLLYKLLCDFFFRVFGIIVTLEQSPAELLEPENRLLAPLPGAIYKMPPPPHSLLSRSPVSAPPCFTAGTEQSL